MMIQMKIKAKVQWVAAVAAIEGAEEEAVEELVEVDFITRKIKMRRNKVPTTLVEENIKLS